MDPFKQLGLERGASTAEVKKAFKALAMQYHPDRHVTSSASEQALSVAKFKSIKEAYELLVDERKRAAYEAGRATGAYAGYSHAHNVNTDWARTHYDPHWERPGYTARMSQWEFLRRTVRAGVRGDASLHVGLGVILVGGFLVFEYVNTAVWRLRNAGKSFEDMQAQRLRAAAEAAQSSAAAGGAGIASSSAASGDGGSGGIKPWVMRSAWADNMKGRFLPDTATGSSDAGSSSGSSSSSGSVAGSRAGNSDAPRTPVQPDLGRHVDRAVLLRAPSPPGQMGGYSGGAPRRTAGEA